MTISISDKVDFAWRLLQKGNISQEQVSMHQEDIASYTYLSFSTHEAKNDKTKRKKI